jgi:hypothetical protein
LYCILLIRVYVEEYSNSHSGRLLLDVYWIAKRKSWKENNSIIEFTNERITKRNRREHKHTQSLTHSLWSDENAPVVLYWRGVFNIKSK